MANRSYLYTIGFSRAERERRSEDKIVGLSEYAYSIPISYKILLSCNPQFSSSIIWNYEHPIAIQADFKLGRERLFKFLGELERSELFNMAELDRQIAATKDFLNEQRLEYVFMEGGELYQMEDVKLEDQNARLLEKVKNIEHEIQETLRELTEMKLSLDKLNFEIEHLKKPRSFISEIFSADETEKIRKLEQQVKNQEQNMWNVLGINNWSNILYYHFKQ